MIRFAALVGLAFVAACGGRADVGTSETRSSSSSVSSTSAATKVVSSSTVSTSTVDTGGGPLADCPVAFGTQGLDVYGSTCFPGGPPTGACEVGASACTYCAIPVLCSPTYGPRTFYDCTCSDGAWSCTVSGLDGSLCAPSDGGAVDAAGDGALGAASDAAVTTDGAVCAPGQIVCPVGCSIETECTSARACVVPPCLPPQP
jgi:hypothetical protein